MTKQTAIKFDRWMTELINQEDEVTEAEVIHDLLAQVAEAEWQQEKANKFKVLAQKLIARRKNRV